MNRNVDHLNQGEGNWDDATRSHSANPRDAAFRTRTVHAGQGGGPVRPVSDPIVFGTSYAFADAATADSVAQSGAPLYARDGMPNVRALERAVADLEGADDAVATASGMAALSLTMLTLLSAGDHVVLNAGCYQDTVSLLEGHFTRFGVRVSVAARNDPEGVLAAMTPMTRIVFSETITNPGIVVSDIAALAGAIRPFGALLAIDNTFATPALCHPLAHGADLVLHSAGKFLGGHHDATGGIVAGRHELIGPIRRAGYLFGPLLGPLDAWLILRGIRTLAPRLSWMSASALRIAAALTTHPAICAVRYPGLPDPERGGIAERHLPHGSGAMLAFDLAGGTDAAVAFTQYLRTIPYVASVGGTETIISFPPLPPSEQTSDPARDYRCATLRMSVGLEDPVDLIADITQALDRLPTQSPATTGGIAAANGRLHETSPDHDH